MPIKRSLIMEKREEKVQKKLLRKMKNAYIYGEKSVRMVYKHIQGNLNGFTAYWREFNENGNVVCQVNGVELYDPECLYLSLKKIPLFAVYLEKQKIRSWEELVYYVEDREEAVEEIREYRNRRMHTVDEAY